LVIGSTRHNVHIAIEGRVRLFLYFTLYIDGSLLKTHRLQKRLCHYIGLKKEIAEGSILLITNQHISIWAKRPGKIEG